MMEQPRDTTKNRFSDVVKALKISELTDVPCFFSKEDKWCAAEELTLLAALQTYGYGNWNVIADTLSNVCKKDFTSLEVQQHYNDVYLEGEIGNAIRKFEIPPLKSSLVDHTTSEDDELLDSCDMNAYLNVPQDFLEKIGYMPLREDFVMECMPNVEVILKRVRFKENMEEFDKNLNLLIVDAYRNKVKERIMKKKMIKALRIVEQFYKKYTAKKSKRSKSKQKKYSATKNLKIVEEHSYSTMSNIYYMLLRRLSWSRDREEQKNGLLQHSLECPPISPSLLSTMFPKNKKDEFYKTLFADDKAPLKSEKQDVVPKQIKKETEKSIDLFSETTRRSLRLQRDEAICLTPAVKKEVKNIPQARRVLRSGKVVEEDSMDVCSDPSSSSKDSSDSDIKNRASTSKTGQPSKLSIPSDGGETSSHKLYCYPWVEYLAENEIKLCSKLKLQPMQYIVYKAFLVKEDLRRRQGKIRNSNLVPAGMTVANCISIFNFGKCAGWIKTPFEEFIF